MDRDVSVAKTNQVLPFNGGRGGRAFSFSAPSFHHPGALMHSASPVVVVGAVPVST